MIAAMYTQESTRSSYCEVINQPGCYGNLFLLGPYLHSEPAHSAPTSSWLNWSMHISIPNGWRSGWTLQNTWLTECPMA